MSDKIPKDSDGAKLTGGPGATSETSEARLSIKFFIWRRRSEWPGWLDRVHQLRGRGGPKDFFLDKPERVTALKNQHAAEVIVWFLNRSQPSELEGSEFSTVQPVWKVRDPGAHHIKLCCFTVDVYLVTQPSLEHDCWCSTKATQCSNQGGWGTRYPVCSSRRTTKKTC